MYQFSRSMYRELAAFVAPENCGVGNAKARLLTSCEAAVERLAADRHYFASPARSLFNDVRMLFPLSKQLVAFSVIERHMRLAADYTSGIPDQPALTVVSRVFFALFALDFDALSQDFTMAGADGGKTGWQLRLAPRTAALGSVFKQALVSGDATVKSVRLEDANGDVTEIELRDVQYDPKGPTADERRRF